MWLSWYHLHSLLPHGGNLCGPSRQRGTTARISPITEATGEFYFRARRFLLAASGSFFTAVNVWAFHLSPTLWT